MPTSRLVDAFIAVPVTSPFATGGIVMRKYIYFILWCFTYSPAYHLRPAVTWINKFSSAINLKSLNELNSSYFLILSFVKNFLLGITNLQKFVKS